MGVHPSMLTHWKTVNMARPMLSNEVMPKLGPCHFSKQTDVSGSHVNEPIGAVSGGPGKQGLPPSPSKIISSASKYARSSDLTAISFESLYVHSNCRYVLCMQRVR